MWSEQQSPRSYFHKVLSDGATPFRYRSGPRSLLGVPDSGVGKLAFSPTVPPVGFTFIDQPFMKEPYIIQHPPNEFGYFSSYNDQGSESEFEGSKEALRVTIGQNVSINEARIDIPGVSEKGDYNNVKNNLGENSNMINGMHKQDGALLESKEEIIQSQMNKKAKKANGIIEKANFDVPGVSEKREKHFSSLSSVKKDDTSGDKTVILSSAKKGGNLSDKPEGRALYEIYSANSKKGFADEPLFKAENETPINPAIDYGNTFEKMGKKTNGNEKGISEPLTGMDIQATGHVYPAGGNLKFTMNENIFLQKKNPSPSGTEKRNASDHYSIPLVSGHIGSEAVNRAGADANEEINRIRHAVQDLVIKKSAQQARLYDDTLDHQPEKAPPPPPQQLVVIRQASNPGTRTPCAFWDRSYLGRFHMKILR